MKYPGESEEYAKGEKEWGGDTSVIWCVFGEVGDDFDVIHG